MRITFNALSTILANSCSSLHLFIYAALLLLDSSVKYLINKGTVIPAGDETAIADWHYSVKLGHWSACAALAAVLSTMTITTLLNRSLDVPGTLLINNRYHRLAPRILLVVVILCLPVAVNSRTFLLFTIIMALTMTVFIWEYIASLEKGARVFEPKEASD